jgi:hypothetical protein
MPSKPLTHWAVIDQATLRFVVGADQVAVHSAAGEVLATIALPDGDPTDAAWQRRCALEAADAVLGQARVVRETPTGAQRCGVALYNPHTCEVALGALPGTRSFGDGEPLELDRFGSAASVVDDGLLLGDRLLEVVCASREHLTTQAAAHHA